MCFEHGNKKTVISQSDSPKNINYDVARKDLDVPFCKIAKFSLINKPLSFKKIPF